jgi:hypothetical protein
MKHPHIMHNVGWSLQLNDMNESLYKTQDQKIRTLWIMIACLVSDIVIAKKHSSLAVLIVCEGNLYALSTVYPELRLSNYTSCLSY